MTCINGCGVNGIGSTWQTDLCGGMLCCDTNGASIGCFADGSSCGFSGGICVVNSGPTYGCCSDTCVPGSTRCSGRNIETCSSGCAVTGNPATWSTTGACSGSQCCNHFSGSAVCFADSALCDNGWYCDAGAGICDLATPPCVDICTTPASRCISPTTAEICSGGCPATPGDWTVTAVCDTLSPVCHSGACVGNACVYTPTPDSGGAMNGNPGQCCDASGNSVTPTCTFATYRCVGLRPEPCEGDCPHAYTFQPLECSAPVCSDPICTPGAFPCTIQDAPVDTGGALNGDPGECCDGNGNSVAPICTYGTYRCNGVTVQQCLGDCPHSWQDQNTCTAPDACREPTCSDGAAYPAACGESSTAHAYKSSCGTGLWCLPAAGLRSCSDIDECGDDGHMSNPVSPRGSCVDNAAPLTSWTASCFSGWSGGGAGGTCSVDVPGCAGNVCNQGGGNGCTDDPAPSVPADAHTCSCVTGWTGGSCFTDINGCSGSPCSNGSPSCGQAWCTDVSAPSPTNNAHVCGCNTGFYSTGGNEPVCNNIDGCAGDICNQGDVGGGATSCTDHWPSGCSSPTNNAHTCGCRDSDGWYATNCQYCAPNNGFGAEPRCYNWDGCQDASCNAGDAGGGSIGNGQRGSGCTDATPELLAKLDTLQAPEIQFYATMKRRFEAHWRLLMRDKPMLIWQEEQFY